MEAAPTLGYGRRQRRRRLRVVAPLVILLVIGTAAAGWHYRVRIRGTVSDAVAEREFAKTFDRAADELTPGGSPWLAAPFTFGTTRRSRADFHFDALLRSRVSARHPWDSIPHPVLFTWRQQSAGRRYLTFACVVPSGLAICTFDRAERGVNWVDRVLDIPSVSSGDVDVALREASLDEPRVRTVLEIDGAPRVLHWSIQPPGPPATGTARSFSGPVGWVVTPEDGWVASGAWAPSPPGWDFTAGAAPDRSIGKVEESAAIAFLPDGRLAVAAPKKLTLVDAESGEAETHSFPDTHRPAEVFVFSPDGTKLFVGGDVLPAWLVDSPTGRVRTLAKHTVGWGKAAFADERTLLFVDDTSRARVDWETQRATLFGVDGFASFYRFGAGGGRVALPLDGPNFGVGVFDVAGRHEVRRLPAPRDGQLSLSPDGRSLAVRDERFALFDVASGESLLDAWIGYDVGPGGWQISWSADGLRGAVTGSDAVYVFSLAEPRWMARLPHGLAGSRTAVALSADGRRLAACASASTAIAYWSDLDAAVGAAATPPTSRGTP